MAEVIEKRLELIFQRFEGERKRIEI